MPSSGYGSWSGDSVQGSNPGVFTMWNEWSSDLGNGTKNVYDQEIHGGKRTMHACMHDGDYIFTMLSLCFIKP
jgi:hypothetical protein